MTWCSPALAFAVWTLVNLLPRALHHHKWYQETFSDYPPENYRNRAISYVYEPGSTFKMITAAAPGWVPVQVPPSQEMTALPPTPACWRLSFDPSAWLAKNAGQEVYLICNPDIAAMRRLSKSRMQPVALCSMPSIRICGFMVKEPSPVKANP